MDLDRVLAIARHKQGGAALPPGALEADRASAFRSIYRERLWGSGGESASGPGSAVAAAAGAVEALLQAVERVGARSVLDVGCGDFNWLGPVLPRLAERGVERVVGCDIVAEAFADARSRHPSVSFEELDVVTQRPGRASDLVVCRQCLNHMSPPDALRALSNLAASGCGHLLATTYDADADADGQLGGGLGEGTRYRCYNLSRPPFRAALGDALASWDDEYDPNRRAAGGNPMRLALWRLPPPGLEASN